MTGLRLEPRTLRVFVLQKSSRHVLLAGAAREKLANSLEPNLKERSELPVFDLCAARDCADFGPSGRTGIH